MITALATDFAALDGVRVTALRDARLSNLPLTGCRITEVRNPREEQDSFFRLAGDADWTMVVAPETNGLLHQRIGWVEQAGGRLLGPPPGLVALASDKHGMTQHLAKAGVPVPDGRFLEPGEPLPTDFPYPAVLKPIDGAGSVDTMLLSNCSTAISSATMPRRLERYCPGLPASVALLCGGDSPCVVGACRQNLSADGQFRYLGGAWPLPIPLRDRAISLARQAVATLEEPLGYIGVDLVLGSSLNGSDDVVVEINPRLTTSYVGLRAVVSDNLAEAILAAIDSRPVTLSFHAASVEFDKDGTVRVCRSVGL